jgi:hypothetical protein
VGYFEDSLDIVHVKGVFKIWKPRTISLALKRLTTLIPIFFGIFFKKKSEKIGGVASSFSAGAAPAPGPTPEGGGDI